MVQLELNLQCTILVYRIGPKRVSPHSNIYACIMPLCNSFRKKATAKFLLIIWLLYNCNIYKQIMVLKIKAYIHWNKSKRLNFTCTSTYETDSEYTESGCTYYFQGREFFKGLWNYIVFPVNPLLCGATVCEIFCNVHICLTVRRQWGDAVKFIGSI